MFAIMRHSEAEPYAATDRERRLTEHGKKLVKKVVKKYLQVCSRPPEIIFTSPALRARETAEIFAEICGLDREKSVLTVPQLYTADAQKILDELEVAGDGALVVCHDPSASIAVASLYDDADFCGLAPCDIFLFDAERENSFFYSPH